ncbi:MULTISPECIES: helix-turn-helix domain-containing protein [Intestinimonas]|jgi:transcriptional regulator with XRE-family HTH domain|uniref:helix-turn-helix domain-containing protein n=1 Tax=Intestinimonas TaxID=1392389 RepID=UPI00067E82E0|nr:MULTISPECIES: helix-turn-helix transcriptional regulator [Intestinimonas]MBS6283786.1 helix-turn-helix transcriptional regulator [Oscillospiraceae bacterium]MDU1326313.1 helix-turn-helix transcriptional regulator [Clostridiales bacterium]CUQ33738.1 XRE family transcriptional regulator [Flavonifractor plautii]SCJ55539.1 Helix-turn-helix [uncultured Flavonifractor sp.]MCI5561573.1 helix-turn-helix transcriptional regulator [Intestinimonas massiliensis (ex Afouda et al. 2020)]
MLSTRLKELKDQRKLTNQQLSDLSGVPVGTINRIMAGQTDNPSFQTVCDMVMAMGGSLDELAGIQTPGGGEPSPPGEDLIRLYERTIEGKEKWLYRLFFLCCVLVAVLLGVLIYDLTHPMVGFFRQ